MQSAAAAARVWTQLEKPVDRAKMKEQEGKTDKTTTDDDDDEQFEDVILDGGARKLHLKKACLIRATSSFVFAIILWPLNWANCGNGHVNNANCQEIPFMKSPISILRLDLHVIVDTTTPHPSSTTLQITYKVNSGTNVANFSPREFRSKEGRDRKVLPCTRSNLYLFPAHLARKNPPPLRHNKYQLDFFSTADGL